MIIRDLRSPEDIAALHDLRLRVLRPGRPPEAAVWALDGHPDTVHLGAFQGATCVGIASVVPEEGWRLRGMAVEPDLQGTGVGAALVHALQERFGQVGRVLWCNARTSAAGFYVRLGFVIEGEPFDLPGIGPHVVMRWAQPVR